MNTRRYLHIIAVWLSIFYILNFPGFQAVVFTSPIYEDSWVELGNYFMQSVCSVTDLLYPLHLYIPHHHLQKYIEKDRVVTRLANIHWGVSVLLDTAASLQIHAPTKGQWDSYSVWTLTVGWFLKPFEAHLWHSGLVRGTFQHTTCLQFAKPIAESPSGRFWRKWHIALWRHVETLAWPVPTCSRWDKSGDVRWSLESLLPFCVEDSAGFFFFKK